MGQCSWVVAQWNWQWCHVFRWLPQATNVLKCLKKSPSSVKITFTWASEIFTGPLSIFCRPSAKNDWPAKVSLGMQIFFTGPVDTLWNILNMVVGLLGMWKYFSCPVKYLAGHLKYFAGHVKYFTWPAKL